jgi:hypothetical protein
MINSGTNLNITIITNTENYFNLYIFIFTKNLTVFIDEIIYFFNNKLDGVKCLFFEIF